MATGQQRNFPANTLEEALVVPRKIQDEAAGKPFNRLLLADALGIKPGSSRYRELLSSAYKYGLTEGTEKASEIRLTTLGAEATDEREDAAKRQAAIRRAAYVPTVLGDFYRSYENRKLPSADMMRKLLSTQFKVPAPHAEEAAELLIENGRLCGIVRDIGGAPHILLAEAQADPAIESEVKLAEDVASGADPAGVEDSGGAAAGTAVFQSPGAERETAPRAIFVGHGKKHGPRDKVIKILDSFKIPHKVAEEEANLGRPISQKVKQTMLQCGSAILIFTCDESLKDDAGDTVWRPSENVVYELGAASFAYEDKVVIFKEKGLKLATNYSGVGHIEFEEALIEAKATELLKELIGFGLVKITPVS